MGDVGCVGPAGTTRNKLWGTEGSIASKIRENFSQNSLQKQLNFCIVLVIKEKKRRDGPDMSVFRAQQRYLSKNYQIPSDESGGEGLEDDG